MSDTPAPENVEWQLADLVDALAGEVDRAQDTLLFKANTRSLSVSLRGLGLDLEVDARVDGAGRIFFRTVEPGQVSATVLRLQFAEVTQGQLEEVSRPVDTGPGSLPLATLPGIEPGEIAALEAVSIFTVDDLRRAASTPARVAELGRRTGVAEIRLRRWLGLPFLERIVPPAGRPGQEAVVEGGNLGLRDEADAIYFQGTAAEILSWSPAAVRVRVPAGARAGTVYGLLDGAATNTLPWEAAPPFLLESIAPATGTPGQLFAVRATGQGFQAGAELAFGAGIKVQKVTVVSASQMTAEIEIGLKAPPGPRDVMASLPGGEKVLLEKGFTVLAAAPRRRRAAPAAGGTGPGAKRKKDRH